MEGYWRSCNAFCCAGSQHKSGRPHDILVWVPAVLSQLHIIAWHELLLVHLCPISQRYLSDSHTKGRNVLESLCSICMHTVDLGCFCRLTAWHQQQAFNLGDAGWIFIAYFIWIYLIALAAGGILLLSRAWVSGPGIMLEILHVPL